MANLKNYLNESVRHLPVKDKRLAKKFTDTSFWVLTHRKRGNLSKADDIFEANFEDLVLQIQGGLDLGEIKGIYADKKDAEKEFERLKEILGQ